MKNFKKFLLLMMCVGVLCGVTACGKNKDTNNGTVNTTDDNRMNDATSGRDKADRDGDGVVDDAVDNATDAIDNAADDLTDNNRPEKDNLNDRNTNEKTVDENKADNNAANNR